MQVNGRLITMDSAPTEINGRVLLPISQIQEAFSNRNVELSWNNNTKQLTINR